KGVSSPGASSIVNTSVTAIFEDREGNIWIGGPRGVERLRESTFVTYGLPGLRSQSIGPLYADANDRIWLAPIEGGLRWLKGTTRESLQIAGLNRDVVYSITGRSDDLWVGRQRGGLTNLRFTQGAITAKTYTQADGLAQNSVYVVYQSRDGTVWCGTINGGVSELRNGHFATYTTSNGLRSDSVSSIAEDADGTMWFGTPNGLTSMSKSGWRTYTADESSSSDVNCLLLDSNGVLWIGTSAGLAMLAGDRIHMPQGLPESLHEPIFAIEEDRSGRFWIATAGHVLQVKLSRPVGGESKDANVREHRVEDGLMGTEGVKRFRSIVTDLQGRVWLSTNRGLSVVNPARASVNSVPALVNIEAVLVDGISFDLREPIRISAAKQKTTFRYVGLSLS